MKKILVTLRNVVGTAGLVLIAYVFVRSIPDVRRYVKISMM